MLKKPISFLLGVVGYSGVNVCQWLLIVLLHKVAVLLREVSNLLVVLLVLLYEVAVLLFEIFDILAKSATMGRFELLVKLAFGLCRSILRILELSGVCWIL